LKGPLRPLTRFLVITVIHSFSIDGLKIVVKLAEIKPWQFLQVTHSKIVVIIFW
jgi:hypothetical protein